MKIRYPDHDGILRAVHALATDTSWASASHHEADPLLETCDWLLTETTKLREQHAAQPTAGTAARLRELRQRMEHCVREIDMEVHS